MNVSVYTMAEKLPHSISRIVGSCKGVARLAVEENFAFYTNI